MRPPGSGRRRLSATPLVRIVLAQPAAQTASGERYGTRAALARLGREVALEVVRDAADCLERVADGRADLVVIERELGPAVAQVLAALRVSGPPVLVVSALDREQDALEDFRRGAADCIVAGPDYGRVLPVVALEQIARWRAARERGAVERRLERLQHLNDAIVQAIPAALAVLEADGCVASVNPEFARSFGVAADAVAGRRLETLLPADLVPQGDLAALLARAAQGEELPPRVARSAGPDGALRAFDLRAAPLGAEGRLLLVLSDVTVRERLMKNLADLQHYGEMIIQNMNSALLVLDGSGRISFCNSTAEHLLGDASGPLRGRRFDELFPQAPAEPGLLARTLAEGERFAGVEALARRADGSSVPVGISCGPLLDSDGTRRGAVAMLQDLSLVKEMQRNLLQTEKMASIGQLAAGVAHEINNPMGFIHANLFQMAEYLADLRGVWEHVEALQRAVAADDREAIRAAGRALDERSREVDARFLLADLAKAVRESQEGSERIRHIVQDLRHFSRHDARQRVQADVNECLDSTANIVWTMMKHSAVLEKQYAELPPVLCYPTQLKQVFMNLLVNAYQAIQERVGSSGETGVIQLCTERRGEGVLVRVRDSGVGIPAEIVDRIFDPFFTTKEVGAGMGLGLSTSFTIVQRHGGTIRVESVPGEGSCFEVWLPIREAGAATPESA